MWVIGYALQEGSQGPHVVTHPGCWAALGTRVGSDQIRWPSITIMVLLQYRNIHSIPMPLPTRASISKSLLPSSRQPAPPPRSHTDQSRPS